MMYGRPFWRWNWLVLLAVAAYPLPHTGENGHAAFAAGWPPPVAPPQQATPTDKGPDDGVDPSRADAPAQSPVSKDRPSATATLSDLLLGGKAGSAASPAPADGSTQLPSLATLQFPDAAQLTETGLRILDGKHIRIVTDLPETEAVERLANIFDRAVPLWADYFHVPPDDLADWTVFACVMANEDRFRTAGLVPRDLPPFRHGLHVGDWLWVREAPTDYFRQHLLLHEGVHAFMRKFLGGTGPPWFREGMAEYLATYHFRDGPLRVGEIPRRARDVPGWGRIAHIRGEFEAGKALMIRDIMEFTDRDFQDDGAYAWSWAAVAFLDGHPSYQRRFRALRRNVRDETITFSRMFEVELSDELRELDEQWQIFVAQCEYGYDLVRNAVTYGAGHELPPAGQTVTVDVAKGWQSSGIHLQQGKSYELKASGQFQIAFDGQPWTSQADGVTLRYHRGFPLGMLMGNLRRDQAQPGLANLASPLPIGSNGRIEPVASGTLYFLIHDHPGKRSDNAGRVTVQIRQLP